MHETLGTTDSLFSTGLVEIINQLVLYASGSTHKPNREYRDLKNMEPLTLEEELIAEESVCEYCQGKGETIEYYFDSDSKEYIPEVTTCKCVLDEKAEREADSIVMERK